MLQIYNTISDKCVGNLLSARKHGFVSFEGEMLYQVRGKLFFLFSVFFFFFRYSSREFFIFFFR